MLDVAWSVWLKPQVHYFATDCITGSFSNKRVTMWTGKQHARCLTHKNEGGCFVSDHRLLANFSSSPDDPLVVTGAQINAP